MNPAPPVTRIFTLLPVVAQELISLSVFAGQEKPKNKLGTFLTKFCKERKDINKN